MEQQWYVSLEDCMLVPLIVMVKELVALGGELKIGNYAIEVYQGYICTQTNSTYNMIGNGLINNILSSLQHPNQWVCFSHDQHISKLNNCSKSYPKKE